MKSKQGFRPTLRMGINGFPFFVTFSMEEFTLGSHSCSSLILQLIVYPAMSHFLKLIIVAASGVRRNFPKGGERTQDLAKEGAQPGVLGGSS